MTKGTVSYGSVYRKSPEQAKPHRQETGQWLPGAGGPEGCDENALEFICSRITYGFPRVYVQCEADNDLCVSSRGT